jgi:hypothetical protein
MARPFLLQGVFDFGLSPLTALELAFRDFAANKAVNVTALPSKRSIHREF